MEHVNRRTFVKGADPICAHAADAGVVHYCIEQDTTPDTGSLAAMRLCAENLQRAIG